MNKMNLNTLDLNLLKVFVAVWDLRSISAAGDRLGLTQPAISHALKRLREHFSDPLFLRVGHRMQPTDMAQRLYEPLNRALKIIAETVLNSEEFDPATSDRSFTIAMSDISEFYCLPKLLVYLQHNAPSIRIKSVQLDAQSAATSLRTGQIDLVLGYMPHLAEPDFISKFVLEDWFICLIASSHLFKSAELTQNDFSNLTFVEVATHATGYRMVDTYLTQQEVRRDVALRLEHYINVPQVIQNSQYAAIFPNSASQKVNANGDFRLLSIPFAIPRIDVKIHIHATFKQDSGIRWMQDAVVASHRIE
ncbi:LysR family transcriptional regulator [Rhizobium rhizoryzae]|uniref:DNA-binding transcriptional LysR family regulator n=1 Tax=Rhizobium rhizoryzae TaxID=451876 RepID=A0A7W6PRW2_9HYPH|nr:LysR family transcriptional regulator [Rhizobium rhizoryzae]MBB4145660.1 DNA-binding transcriptional LysR family regulator [Rhizobium rhizoryzae]